MTQEVKTAGAPAKVLLKADRSKIKADGRDLSFITATVMDKNGVVVPKANNLITFSVNGEGFIAGVDNGSPTSHEAYKANQRQAFNRQALAILQNKGKKGSISVSANAAGLEGSTLIIAVQ